MKRILRTLSATAVLAAAAGAGTMDSVVVLPIGPWDMNNEPIRPVSLASVTGNYSDILDIEVLIRSDFQDGWSETYNSAKLNRLDRFPKNSNSDGGKGGTFWVQPGSGQLTLMLAADRAQQDFGSGGNANRVYRSAEYQRTVYYNPTLGWIGFNRGFVVVHFKGLNGSGVSGNAANMRHFYSSVAFNMGGLSLADLDGPEDSIPLSAWTLDVNPTRILGLGLSVFSNPSGGYIGVTSGNTKPTIGTGTDPLGRPSRLSLGGDGGSYLWLQPGVFTSNTFYGGVAAFSGTSGNRGYYHVSHYPTSCDDYAEEPLPRYWSFSKIPSNDLQPYECGGTRFVNQIMQSRGTSLTNTVADNATFYGRSLTASNRTLEARVDFVEKTSSGSRAGVAFRNSLNANSRYFGVFVNPAGQILWQRRTSDGATTTVTTVTPSAGGKLPVHVRLVKSGNTFTGYYRPANSGTWISLGSASSSTAFSSTFQAGMLGAKNSTNNPSAYCTMGLRQLQDY